MRSVTNPVILKDENGTENAEVRYRIVRGKNAANFTIDSVSGELRPNGLIDFELIPPSADGETRKFELLVRAHDLGNPPQHSDVPVTIFVTDRNDHAPRFERSHYRVSIDEDAPGGTSVMQVKAYDGDGSSPNSDIVFRLRSGAKDKFVVDSETGVISVSQGADLDPDQSVPRSFSYLIEVAAIDGGLGDTRLTGTATVNVTVRDVNNKPPYFDYPSMRLSILENVNVGTFVTSVSASDPDRRASLRYSLDQKSSVATSEDGRIPSEKEFDVSDVFALNTRTGELRVQGKLDRELVNQIKLVVVARDIAADSGDQTATVVLDIAVIDENDNNPRFKKPSYKASVPENSAIGTRILSVQATDADQNRTILYSLEGNDATIRLLEIDTETGDISARQRIDRERVNWLNFTVRATDSGFPPRSSFAHVFVSVVDENDNAPVFDERYTPTNITVVENITVGTVIARVVATDADSGEYGKVTYFLDRRSASLGKFRLDAEKGELIVAGPLDREEKDSYVLLIEAYDNYQFGFSLGESRRSFAQLQVTVADVNDEAPVFEAPEEGDAADAGCALITEFHEVREAVVVIRGK